MTRKLTVVLFTGQLPAARLPAGPLLGAAADHLRLLLSTMTGDSYSLRAGGTGSYKTVIILRITVLSLDNIQNTHLRASKRCGVS